MDILKDLEGEQKTPVEEQQFIDHLVKSEKFDEEGAKNYLRKMIRENTIYESKPGYYNRV